MNSFHEECYAVYMYLRCEDANNIASESYKGLVYV